MADWLSDAPYAGAVGEGRGLTLYHVTAARNRERIFTEGLRAPSYWALDEALVAYYEETVRDEGDEPLVLAVRIEDLDRNCLEGDQPGIDEPITTVIGLAEEAIGEAWAASGRTAIESLRLVGSCRYRSRIAPALLAIQDGGEAPEPS